MELNQISDEGKRTEKKKVNRPVRLIILAMQILCKTMSNYNIQFVDIQSSANLTRFRPRRTYMLNGWILDQNGHMESAEGYLVI